MLGRTLAAAAGLTLTAALSTPATAVQAAPTASVPCSVEAASATTAGDHFRAYIEATKPIKRSDLRPARGTLNLPVRYYADWWLNPDADWNTRGLGGYLVAGDVLYDLRYWVEGSAEVPKDSRLVRIGGGWTGTFTNPFDFRVLNLAVDEPLFGE